VSSGSIIKFSIMHRMGENLMAQSTEGRPLMRYRENTIHAFNTAAAAGASFVEFDVQVDLNFHSFL